MPPLRLPLARVATLEASDPRLIMVTAAASLAATEAYHRAGWRRAPAQCPIALEAIRGASHGETIALLTAWNGAFHRRLIALQAKDIAL
jgi:hypothetical protein